MLELGRELTECRLSRIGVKSRWEVWWPVSVEAEQGLGQGQGQGLALNQAQAGRERWLAVRKDEKST